MKKILILSAFLCVAHLAWAQQNAQIKQLLATAEAHRVQGDIVPGLQNIRRAATIGQQQKDWQGLSYVYAALSRTYIYTDSILPASRAADSASLYASQTDNNQAKAAAYMAQSYLHSNIDEDEKAIGEAHKGLQLLEKNNDPQIATLLHYIVYGVYSGWDNVPKLAESAKLALQNAYETNDKNLLTNCYIAVSVAHQYDYEATKNISARDSMLYYLQKVLATENEFPQLVGRQTYSIACINIADYYYKYFPQNDRAARDSAFYYLNLAKEATASIKNSNGSLQGNVYGILSEYALRDGNAPLAEVYLLQAVEIMKKVEHPYYYTLTSLYTSLSNLYEKQLDFKNALKYQKEAEQARQKLFDEQQILNTQKLEIQYETEKRSREMETLKERAESRRMQNYLYIGIAVASLAGLIFMFRAYHYKLRYSMQREKQLLLEKQDAALQVKFEKEAQARLKAEQLLMEAKQQQLQKEVMANALHLEHKNEMLQQLSDDIEKGNAVNTRRLLKEELLLDDDFEQTKLHLQKMHPDFFKMLSEKSVQKLTALDLKYCTYLHLKMDTRQIAQLLHVETQSVRMAKYRIKQKLGLGKDDDLDAYLQKV